MALISELDEDEEGQSDGEVDLSEEIFEIGKDLNRLPASEALSIFPPLAIHVSVGDK